MPSVGSAQDSNSKQPRRHYAEAFAKDNSAFPLFIVWKVTEDVEYDEDGYSKKARKSTKAKHPQAAAAAASS